MATLGRAYNNLGLFNEGRTALEGALPTIRRSGADEPRRCSPWPRPIGSRGAGQGDAGGAPSRSDARPDLKQNTLLRGEAALTMGKILSSASNVKAGVAAFDRALTFFHASDNVLPR